MLTWRVGAENVTSRALQCFPTVYVTRQKRREIHQGDPTAPRPNALVYPRQLPDCAVSSRVARSNRRAFGSSAALGSNATGGYTYRVAAAYCGKSHKFDPNRHYFSYDQSTSSRTRSGQALKSENFFFGKDRLPSGQDACFVSNVGHTQALSFGLADGVGGWQTAGIDSAAFAHGICMYMEDAARSYQPTAPVVTPLDLLRIGYDRTCKDKSIQGGGSTACLAVADELGTLSIANLGDSGFIQVRQNKVHHYSDPQTHAFNTPYQLARIPPKILAQIEAFGGGSPLSDTPDDASVMELALQHGDVIVFATDGVWDNLTSQDLLSIICDRMEDCHAWEDGGLKGTQVGGSLAQLTEDQGPGYKSLHELLAIEIVQSAKEASLNEKRDGPFARAFQRVYPEERYTGGKPDDIAVMVAIPLDPTFAPSIKPSAQKSSAKI